MTTGSYSISELYFIGTTYDLNTKNELPCVKFALFHKGMFLVSEAPLGEVIVPLADINPDGMATDQWYPIKKVGRMEVVSGEVCHSSPCISPAICCSSLSHFSSYFLLFFWQSCSCT